jgi:hypothetical protein
MKLANKYIALWSVVWLQFYFFFSELQQVALLGQSMPKQLMLLGVVLFCLAFISYFFLLMNRRIDAKKARNYETFFCLAGLLLCGAMLSYMLSNNWLWNGEAGTRAIILEVGSFVLMVISIISANFFHFIKKETIDMNDKKLWSTDNTYDMAFWGALVLSSFLLSLWSSKVPYFNRNYYEFLRVLFVDVIILYALNKNRLFFNQRRLFYAVLIGYFVACTYQTLLALFILNPSLGERIASLGDKTNYVIVVGVLSVIHWLVLAAWVGWDLLAEDARCKLQK